MRAYLPFHCLTALVFVAVVTVYRGVRQDDAYIFYTYARNLVAGHGYVFNAGEAVNGTTSPLYTLLLAGVHLCLRPLVEVSFVTLGWLITAAGFAVVIVTMSTLLHRHGARGAAVLFPLVFLANPTLRHATGMETALTMALAVLAVAAYANESLSRFTVLSALATLSRPDAVLLPLAAVVHRRVTRGCWPELGHVAGFSAIGAPWIIFSIWWFSSPVPTTLGAKLAQRESGEYWGTGYLFLHGFTVGSLAVLVPLSLAALGLLAYAGGFRLRIPAIQLILLWQAMSLFVYAIVLNPPATYPWYYTPLSLPTSVLLALALDALLGRVRQPATARCLLHGVSVLLVAAGLVLAAVVTRLPVRSVHDVYVAAAAWLNAHATDGATVAANEIGILGFHYRKGRVIDALGLVTAGGSRHVRAGNYAWYIHDHSPDYLMFRHPPRAVLEAMVDEDWFHERYVVATVIDVAPRPGSVAIYRKRGPM